MIQEFISLNFAFKLLRFTGFDPRKVNFYSRIMSIVTISSIFLIVGLTIGEAATHFKGLETIDTIIYLPVIALIGIRGIVLLLKREVLLKMISAKFWPLNKFSEEQKKDLMKSHKKIWFFFRYFMCSGCTFLLPFIVAPFALDMRVVIYPVYKFCDFADWNCYMAYFIFENTVILLLLCPLAFGFDLFFLMMIFRGYAAVKLIKTGFIKCDLKHDMLNEVVKQHNVLLRFIRDFKEFIGVEALLQFWSTLVCMVLALTQMTSKGIPPNIYDAIFFGCLYILYATRLALYCFGGTVLMNEVQTISKEVFSIDWTKNTAIRKDLAFIIQRCNYDDKFRAGKMIDMNLLSFSLIIKNSLSTYMLLQTLSTQGN